MTKIQVIQPGSPVKIANETVEGIVSRVCISDKNLIQYEVIWWDGNTRYEVWLDQIEVVRSDQTQGIAIGFQN